MGTVLRGLAVAAFVTGWVAAKWLSGADWRHGYRGRRRITRPVRAVGQTLLAVVVGCALWRPLATAVALAGAGVALIATAVFTRNQTPRLVSQPGPPYRTRAYVDRPRAKIAPDVRGNACRMSRVTAPIRNTGLVPTADIRPPRQEVSR